MTTTPTTPDQGDERRAMTAAYLAFCADKAPDHNEVGFPYFKAAWQARAAQPVAQPVVDQKTASVSDNGSCGSQVSDKPVAQEAIGTFNCPICGNGTPHHHSDFEQVQAMSEEQIDAELRALGIDPDKAAQKVKAVIDHCWAEYDRRLKNPLAAPQPSQGAADSIEPKDDVYTAVLRLDTFRPVRLEFGVTMHRDVIPNDAGWIRREDVLSAIAAPPQPVSAEAGNGEPDPQLCSFYQVSTFPELVAAMEHHIEKLQSKLPSFSCYLQRDHGKAPCDHDCGKLRCMYPSEPVAVRGEVSERVAKCSAILTLIDNYAPEKLGTAERTHLAVAVDAVLALAGSGGKANA